MCMFSSVSRNDAATVASRGAPGWAAGAKKQLGSRLPLTVKLPQRFSVTDKSGCLMVVRRDGGILSHWLVAPVVVWDAVLMVGRKDDGILGHWLMAPVVVRDAVLVAGRRDGILSHWWVGPSSRAGRWPPLPAQIRRWPRRAASIGHAPKSCEIPGPYLTEIG